MNDKCLGKVFNKSVSSPFYSDNPFQETRWTGTSPVSFGGSRCQVRYVDVPGTFVLRRTTDVCYGVGRHDRGNTSPHRNHRGTDPHRLLSESVNVFMQRVTRECDTRSVRRLRTLRPRVGRGRTVRSKVTG